MNECGLSQDFLIYCLDMAVVCLQLTCIYSSQPRMLFLVFGDFMSFLLLMNLLWTYLYSFCPNIVALSNIAFIIGFGGQPPPLLLEQTLYLNYLGGLHEVSCRLSLLVSHASHSDCIYITFSYISSLLSLTICFIKVPKTCL